MLGIWVIEPFFILQCQANLSPIHVSSSKSFTSGIPTTWAGDSPLLRSCDWEHTSLCYHLSRAWSKLWPLSLYCSHWHTSLAEGWYLNPWSPHLWRGALWAPKSPPGSQPSDLYSSLSESVQWKIKEDKQLPPKSNPHSLRELYSPQHSVSINSFLLENIHLKS